jgi:hypothetical protein
MNRMRFVPLGMDNRRFAPPNRRFLYPVEYNYATGMNYGFQFYASQRVGKLPDHTIPWRHDSLLQEYAIPYAGKSFDLGGGYMQGGQVRGGGSVCLSVSPWQTLPC